MMLTTFSYLVGAVGVELDLMWIFVESNLQLVWCSSGSLNGIVYFLSLLLYFVCILGVNLVGNVAGLFFQVKDMARWTYRRLQVSYLFLFTTCDVIYDYG